MPDECPFCKNVELEVIDENEMFERATDDLNHTDTPWFAVICPAPDGCGASGGFAPTKEGHREMEQEGGMNYPPGVTDADFMEPAPPGWVESYYGFDQGLPECDGLEDAIWHVKSAIKDKREEMAELEVLLKELEGYDHEDDC